MSSKNIPEWDPTSHLPPENPKNPRWAPTQQPWRRKNTFSVWGSHGGRVWGQKWERWDELGIYWERELLGGGWKRAEQSFETALKYLITAAPRWRQWRVTFSSPSAHISINEIIQESFEGGNASAEPKPSPKLGSAVTQQFISFLPLPFKQTPAKNQLEMAQLCCGEKRQRDVLETAGKVPRTGAQ